MVRRKFACLARLSARPFRRMNNRQSFNSIQAQEVAETFNAAGVDYLFIGKSGAILLGSPGTKPDVDVFPAKSPANGERIAADDR